MTSHVTRRVQNQSIEDWLPGITALKDKEVSACIRLVRRKEKIELRDSTGPRQTEANKKENKASIAIQKGKKLTRLGCFDGRSIKHRTGPR